MGKRVLLTKDYLQNYVEQFQQAAPEYAFRYRDEDMLLEQDLADVQVIIGSPDPGQLKSCRQLEWLHLCQAGSDTYAKQGVLRPGTLLTNASGAFGASIAEFMVGMTLELCHRLQVYRDYQHAGRWHYAGPVKLVEGATVLVVGAGDIGCAYAKRMKALGAYTIGVRRTNAQQPPELDEPHLIDQLDQLLPRADFISLSLPNSAATYHIINETRLGLCKPDAVLINIGRGSAVDTDALCRALQQGRLWGFGADVTEPEPLPADHPLWRFETVVITPHMSGMYEATQDHDRLAGIAIENLRRYAHGESLNNLVDFSTGYRKR